MTETMRMLRVLALAAVCGTAGCDGEPAPAAEEVRLPGDDKVLATVDGSPISRFDLELGLRTTYGPKVAARLDAAARHEVLESLVASRAMALLAERELDPRRRAVLAERVAAYREKLLVKRYLAAHTPAEPVDQAMIEKYYREHPERFGAETRRSYEMLVSARSLTGPERRALLERLDEAGRRDDWRAWAAELSDEGPQLDYRSGPVSERVLHPRLADVMRRLQPGRASPVTFIQGRAYAVRILSEHARGPRPLAEVRERIVETLEAARLDEAIDRATARVLRQVEVEYR